MSLPLEKAKSTPFAKQKMCSQLPERWIMRRRARSANFTPQKGAPGSEQRLPCAAQTDALIWAVAILCSCSPFSFLMGCCAVLYIQLLINVTWISRFSVLDKDQTIFHILPTEYSSLSASTDLFQILQRWKVPSHYSNIFSSSCAVIFKQRS